MGFVASSAFWMLFGTAIVSSVAASLLWRRRRGSGGTFLSLLMFAVSGYALVGALEAGAVRIPHKVFWSTLEYVCSGATVTFFLLFALDHAGLVTAKRLRKLRVLWLLPLINVAWVATNGLHRLVWTGFEPGTVGTNVIVYLHGPAFYGIVAGLYCYALTAVGILTLGVFQASATRRRQAAVVLVAGTAPLLGGILYTLQLPFLYGINVTPMSFALSGIVFGISVIGFRHFDVVSFARSTVLDIISDGILVLDDVDQIVDANPAALEMLGHLGLRFGVRIGQAIPWWESVGSARETDGTVHSDIMLSEIPPRYANVRVTPLGQDPTSPSGQVVVLRDISLRYEVEQHLQQANDALQQQLDEIQRLQDTLRAQAVHDQLTGLHNRRYLEETLPRELSNAARRGEMLALILLDVDHFKQINDTAGHHTGDRVLCLLADLLSESTRAGDVACRYGGDEFVLVLPTSSLESAVTRADQLRLRFAELSERSSVKATVSIGVSGFPTHGQNRDDLLRQADRALYRAKNEGRNRVCTPRAGAEIP